MSVKIVNRGLPGTQDFRSAGVGMPPNTFNAAQVETVARAFARLGGAAERVAEENQRLFDANWLTEAQENYRTQMIERRSEMEADGAFDSPTGAASLRQFSRQARQNLTTFGDTDALPSPRARATFNARTSDWETDDYEQALLTANVRMRERAADRMGARVNAWTNQALRQPDTMDTLLAGLDTVTAEYDGLFDANATRDMVAGARASIIEGGLRGLIFAGRTDEAKERLASGEFDQDLAPDQTLRLQKAIKTEELERRKYNAEQADVLWRNTMTRIANNDPYDPAVVDQYESLTTERDADRFQEAIVRAERVRGLVDELMLLPPAAAQARLDAAKPDPASDDYANDQSVIDAARQLYRAEWAKVEREWARNAPEARQIMENTAAAIEAGKPIPEGAVEDVTRLAGDQAGAEFAAAVTRSQELYREMQRLNAMAPEEAARWITENMPVDADVPSYAKDLADWQKAVQGYQNYRALLDRDPVNAVAADVDRWMRKWRIDQGLAPEDDSDPREHAVRTEFTMREQQQRGVIDWRVFSNGRSAMQVEQFASLDARQQTDFLEDLASRYAGETRDRAIKDLQRAGLPDAAVLAAGLAGTDRSATVFRIMEGAGNPDAKDLMPTGEAKTSYNEDMDAVIGALFPFDAKAYAQVRDAANAIYVYEAQAASDRTQEYGDEQSTRLQAAINEATGGVISYNAQPILPPQPGYDEDRFGVLMDQVSDEDLAATTMMNGAPLPAAALRDGQASLMSVGPGLYTIWVNGGVILNRGSMEPFVFDFNEWAPALADRASTDLNILGGTARFGATR